MVPVVDSVVLAPAAALRPWHLPELLMMKQSVENC